MQYSMTQEVRYLEFRTFRPDSVLEDLRSIYTIPGITPQIDLWTYDVIWIRHPPIYHNLGEKTLLCL